MIYDIVLAVMDLRSFLYSRYSLCSHSVRAAQKNVTCCTKTMFSHNNQNYVSNKKKL